MILPVININGWVSATPHMGLFGRSSWCKADSQLKNKTSAKSVNKQGVNHSSNFNTMYAEVSRIQNIKILESIQYTVLITCF